MTFLVYCHLCFVSIDTEEEIDDNEHDWLFKVISDIVAAHNSAITNLYQIIHSQELHHLKCLLPEEPSSIQLTEVTERICVVGENTEYVMFHRNCTIIFIITGYMGKVASCRWFAAGMTHPSTSHLRITLEKVVLPHRKQ